MNRRRPARPGFAWLELVLTIAAVALAIQLSPALRSWLAVVIDIRGWSRTSWFVANLVGVLALAAIRFGPDAAQAAHRLVRRRRSGTSQPEEAGEVSADYERRFQRDAEWRERAKKRHPFW